MAILQVNLEKPALVEEYRYPDATSGGTAESAEASGSSGGRAGKLLGLLAVAVGVGLLVWKRRRGGSEQSEFDDAGTEAEFEADVEFEADSGGGKGKAAGVLGVLVGVVGLAVALQKRRR